MNRGGLARTVIDFVDDWSGRRFFLLDTFAVQPDNIESTVVKEGFLKTQDICTAKYQDACKKAGLE